MLQNFFKTVQVRVLIFLLFTREFESWSRHVTDLQCWTASRHDDSADIECDDVLGLCLFVMKAALLLFGLFNFILHGNMIQVLERAKKNALLDVQ